MSTDIIVIGGGAAGMMAALFAAKEGAQVLLLDKNRKLGRKLRITGKGRCNLTNNCERKEFLDNIPGDGRFLHSALAAFSPQDTMQFFEEKGLPLKTERGKRVFPQSDNANDVADLLADICRRSGVTIIQAEAIGISVRDGCVRGVKTQDGLLECRACIICTGGMSYPLTGSTGDGYRFAKSLGHTVTEVRPSLVPLESPDPCCARLQGLTLKNVELRIFEDDTLLCREQGEMLFTHFGISGPLVLSASARMHRAGHARYRAEIDLKPALDEKSLDRRILRDLSMYHNKAFHNALVDLVPHALIPELIRLCGIETEPMANEVTKDLRMRLLHALKAFPIEISGTRPYEEAIITAGGVRLRELDPRSMQSRMVQGLYFAGEVLDLDAYTGGFNLQIAWSTGRLAGISAARNTQILSSGSAT